MYKLILIGDWAMSFPSLRNRMVEQHIGAYGVHDGQAIGVICRSETERESHYFRAALPQQFDEDIRFDDNRAVTPLETTAISGLLDIYPGDV